jgi:hypothetical protein
MRTRRRPEVPETAGEMAMLLVRLLRTYHRRAKSKGAVDLSGGVGENDVTITFEMGDSAFTIRVQGPEFYDEEDAA